MYCAVRLAAGFEVKDPAAPQFRRSEEDVGQRATSNEYSPFTRWVSSETACQVTV
jgi:hypothetical protein